MPRHRTQPPQQQQQSLAGLLLLLLLLLLLQLAAASAVVASSSSAASAASSSSSSAGSGSSVVEEEEARRFVNTTANGVRREGVDTALHRYALLALSRVKDGGGGDEGDGRDGDGGDGVRTGKVYDVPLPPFLQGIVCQAMRVRLGSLRRHGLSFNEFYVPPFLLPHGHGHGHGDGSGAADDDGDDDESAAAMAANPAHSPLILLVYRRVFNFTLYTLSPDHIFVSPVVGIVAYYAPINSSSSSSSSSSASSATASTAPEIDNVLQNASVVYAKLDSDDDDDARDQALHSTSSRNNEEDEDEGDDGQSPRRRRGSKLLRCSFFDINGTASFADPDAEHGSSSTCVSSAFMDVALVLESSSTSSSSSSSSSSAPPPPPSSPASLAAPAAMAHSRSSSPRQQRPIVWRFALIAVFGGILALLLFAAIVYMAFKVGNECRIGAFSSSSSTAAAAIRAAGAGARSGAAGEDDDGDDDDETSSCACPRSTATREDDEDEEISLQTSLIGHTRAPTAPGVRTRPVLETGSLYI